MGTLGVATVGAGVALDACSSSSSPSAQSGGGTPKRGGTLRVGMTGGLETDTLDGDNPFSIPDFMRVNSLYSPMVYWDKDLNLANGVVEGFIPDKTAQNWTIPVKQGVYFSNGKELQAEDIIFTFQRILDPKNAFAGLYGGLGVIEGSSLRAVDKYTVQMTTNVPYASLAQHIATYQNLVVPVGYNPKKPIGSGPFTLESFTPNAVTVFKRNPNYYQSPLPYVDEVILTEYPDFTSLINALISNAEDVIGAIPPSSLPGLKGQPGITVFPYNSANWNPFTMRADVPPFNDNRVREAMRLIVSRPEVIDSAYDGQAILGNDVSGQFDPGYGNPFPQRVQDIAQAKSLLRSAGQSDLQLSLVVIPNIAGALETAEVFKQNAQSAGVTVNFVQPDTTAFDAKYYLQSLFSQDSWPYEGYMAQAAYAYVPGAPFNSTHFNDPQYLKYYAEANKPVSDSLREELYQEMYAIEYNQGTYIIPTFNNVIDAFRQNVHGLTAWKTGFPINSNQFHEIWLD
jgi:peptide/nickel transport system substrate-binding protein